MTNLNANAIDNFNAAARTLESFRISVSKKYAISSKMEYAIRVAAALIGAGSRQASASERVDPLEDSLARAAFASQFWDVARGLVIFAEGLGCKHGNWATHWLDHIDGSAGGPELWGTARKDAPELLGFVTLFESVVTARGEPYLTAPSKVREFFEGLPVTPPVGDEPWYPAWDALAAAAKSCVLFLVDVFEVQEQSSAV